VVTEFCMMRSSRINMIKSNEQLLFHSARLYANKYVKTYLSVKLTISLGGDQIGSFPLFHLL
jgi:hypothetical protein